MHRRLCLFAVVVMALVSCTPDAPRPTQPSGPVAADRPTSPTSPTEPSAATTPQPTAAVAPRFRGTVEPLPADMIAAITGRSWRPGCPVGLAQLRLVRVDYWGFDNAAHHGELVVHADVADAIVRIFASLYQARFPIRQMVPVDAYGADDNASMAADNTSAFNCRRVQGTTTWSRHAYGKAIDINPVENPYLRGSAVLPPAGAAYLNRRRPRSGMILEGDVVTRAFAAEGFRWGGRFRPSADYQHFDVAP